MEFVHHVQWTELKMSKTFIDIFPKDLQCDPQVTYRLGLVPNPVSLVSNGGWINGLFNCFNWSIIGKGKAPQIETSKSLSSSSPSSSSSLLSSY